MSFLSLHGGSILWNASYSDKIHGGKETKKELKKSKGIAIISSGNLTLVAACFIGVIGRAYLFPTILE